MDSEFERIKKVIAEFFVEREGAGILDVIYDINFVDEGIIDSLDIISLAAYIEKNLGRKVDLAGGDALNKIWDDRVMALWACILTFYFGGRQFNKK